MFIGSLIVKIHISYVHSLKEKRSIIKSIMAKLRNKFNVSIAEVAENDQWQIAVIGMSIVSTNKQIIDKQMSEIIDFIEANYELEITEIDKDIF
ncbi:hypothetical protein SAMN00017405_1007 [Desulfonispora thiosulfatigenes DSM 11270]|uniref:DUF503 domain-containing protein n=1 Tax=Desulfonispora thiosulfatigenes DSM 11270 TaxID=656914 RepID=A0A1W1UPW9_DESTI|nr:DUF503 domain-containing protein [Desulfonispora thiosulfatigenes]SMB83152.1 hypothetical protein SAMN00017405_1007 [Desulfonispora thiosulfatigenes DSM 11270]